MSNDIDTSKPASEQFDLTLGYDDEPVTPEEIDGLAADLEAAEGMDVSQKTDERLADFAAALKRLQDAAETARKDVFEDELHERVETGERVGPLSKQAGRNTWVDDAEAAFAAVAEQGDDPMDVAKVSISSLRDVLGDQADQYIGESEYSYFRRNK